MSKRVLVVLVAVAMLSVSLPAMAAVYTEVGDAGQSLLTAQLLPGGVDTVLGNTNQGAADLYRFYWGGGSFYVNSVGSYGDSQLFLFNSTGVGVQGNDDGIAIAGPAYLQLAALSAGYYFLGVSFYDFDPYSAAGFIFQNFPYQGLYGPSNTQPLTGWAYGVGPATSTGGGNYQVNFRTTTSLGEQGDPNPTGDPTSVPEPGTLLLLGSGLLGMIGYARARRNQ